jgi:uncharacterized protein
MKEPSPPTDQRIFDATPYLKLFIDKDGRWFQNQAEIIHPGIFKMFCDALEHSPDGGYLVRMGNQICRVEVEDAPFVVKDVSEQDGEGPVLVLNDGSVEPLQPQSVWIGKDNVPYCRIRNESFPARFSRQAYYRLAAHIVHDEATGEYFLQIGESSERVKLATAP